ncbi:hypothetical protein EJB05_24048 [Eragrostis curvula]|uniref:Aminotransferase class I/classII large domain-containing protein n=1 Tax=Eragrostis curvula TaxID=38414 RepID=A0A5J9V8G1_9POAL|nr:hypothetical protein EJB05_24048 [Eragrostis curvula]
MAPTQQNGHAAVENGNGKAHGDAVCVENGNGHPKAWRFARAGSSVKERAMAGEGDKISIRAVRFKIMASVEERGPRPVLPLAHGDPSVFPAFRTAVEAEDAVAAALHTGQSNCYAAGVGLPAARRALAEHLSHDLPYKLTTDDIFLTAGGTQAIEVVISVLAKPGTNILLPKPGYPNYEARAAFNNFEVRHFDLVPEKGWEIDVDSLEAIADENTTAMVLINPNNPCGSVYSHQHLAKVAEVARKLGILIISDEVYGNLVFGSSPFIPMGVFGHVVPVLTIGSLSKRWIVPGWRLGWVAACDPNKILQTSKITASITNFLNVSTDPATFIQVKLNLYLLEGIQDDVDFCCQLAKEESVILCPGSVLGMENWVRITFAIDSSSLLDGLKRIKSFCERHNKKNLLNGF